ncbi:hypothetical protein D9619_012855 [Psilocybe cf. subviscida]|uniref:Uncharacterized protein n=1 Tax=Psilocybe cf. subviscida TaxID=2480587 RepID=A0A8H5F4W1_9AGAR|nr:hypothetical protein D9619_012855 [Psilocybe cf. subviscida]
MIRPLTQKGSSLATPLYSVRSNMRVDEMDMSTRVRAGTGSLDYGWPAGHRAESLSQNLCLCSTANRNQPPSSSLYLTPPVD